VSTITVPPEIILRVNEVKNQEALRIKKQITHEEFLMFMTKLYKRVAGDSFVLDAAWEKARERK
jgi:secreted Zn-dependent insulinase-like peptidase